MFDSIPHIRSFFSRNYTHWYRCEWISLVNRKIHRTSKAERINRQLKSYFSRTKNTRILISNQRNRFNQFTQANILIIVRWGGFILENFRFFFLAQLKFIYSRLNPRSFCSNKIFKLEPPVRSWYWCRIFINRTSSTRI